MIHPTALVHPGAQLAADVAVGPYAVVDAHVTVGAGSVIGPHVHLTGHTVIGPGNHFHTGAVIGDAPQDLKYRDEPTRLVIGGHNVFREHVTVHRSNKAGEDTVIGDHCLLMAGAHVGHNSHLGSHVILANGALLGGHVTVHDRAFISGTCLLHQFVTVGALSMMQGGAGLSLDLPPFCIATGNNQVCGLNSIGLRRNGATSEQRLELRQLYHLLVRRTKRLADALNEAEALVQSEFGRTFFHFIKASKRGIAPHGRGHDRAPRGEDAAAS